MKSFALLVAVSAATVVGCGGNAPLAPHGAAGASGHAGAAAAAGGVSGASGGSGAGEIGGASGVGATGGVGATSGAGTSGGSGGASGAGGVGGQGAAGSGGLVAPDVPPPLAVGPGAKLVFMLHEEGTNTYSCYYRPGSYNAPTWGLDSTDAQLFDASGAPRGTRNAAPVWDADDGSSVQATHSVSLAAPVAGALAWTRYETFSFGVFGIFTGVSEVQEVNTKGGYLPPPSDCGVGVAQTVPFSADLYFYVSPDSGPGLGGLAGSSGAAGASGHAGASGGGAAGDAGVHADGGDAGAVDAGSHGLMPPAGLPSQLVPPGAVFEVGYHSRGTEVYKCTPSPGPDGGSFALFWQPTRINALLYDDAGQVHGSETGPPDFVDVNWTSTDGSTVNGAPVALAPSPNGEAIAWMLFAASSHAGNGIFETVTYVQQVSTAGGVIDGLACATQGAEYDAGFSADVYFYTN
jgi:hypothetical protein